jgi:tetratricopeptide (TPR) repeat protein
MIVKDEERRIGACLASARPWVDEMVVVDTGSTDRTVEIAQSLGARVYHHAWEGDFAKHRNQSIGYATGDWILQLDADEELDQQTAPCLRDICRSTGADCLLVEMVSYYPGGGHSLDLVPRLFRRRAGLSFEGPIHERPLLKGTATKSPIRVHHHGYNESPQVMEAKRQRRVSMIARWVENCPEDFLARKYLALACLENPHTMPQALEAGLASLALARRQGADQRYYPILYFPVLAVLTFLQRDQEVIARALECIELEPRHPDPHYFLAGAHYRLGRWQEAKAALGRYDQLIKQVVGHPELLMISGIATSAYRSSAWQRWVMASLELGEQDEALAVYQRLLGQEDAEQLARDAVRRALKLELTALAASMADLARQRRPDWSWAAELAGLARRLEKRARGAELKDQGLRAFDQRDIGAAITLLEEALTCSGSDPEQYFYLALAQLRAGRGEQAADNLTRSLNLAGGNGVAWRLLGEHYFGQRSYAAALVCYQQAETLGEPESAARLQVCQRRLAAQAPHPTVRQRPPSLLVFLVEGLDPRKVKAAPPEFLDGRGWGQVVWPDGDRESDRPAWSTMWSALATKHSLGLLAATGGNPLPDYGRWAVAGFPGGLLDSRAVRPGELLPLLLAQGYRSDILLSQEDRHLFCQRIQDDTREEALMYRVDRIKLAVAMDLPVVEVLVVGLSAVQRIHACPDLDYHRLFAAYQVAYAAMGGMLAALAPRDFAIISQGESPQGPNENRVGFYCLSWLKRPGVTQDSGALLQNILARMDAPMA